MFNAHEYARKYAGAAARFAEIATSSRPEDVELLQVDLLDMVREAADNKAEDAFVQLLREAVEARQLGVTAVLVPPAMAELMSGFGRFVAVCAARDVIDGSLPGPMPGIRLFSFMTIGRDASCRHVRAVSPEQWDEREGVKAVQSEEAHNESLRAHTLRLIAAASAFLAECATQQGPQPLRITRLLEDLRQRLVRCIGEPGDLADPTGTIDGVDSVASSLVIMIALSMMIPPSEVFAEAERRVGSFRS